MNSANRVSTLFKQSDPDQYISPQSLGVHCSYEIKKGELHTAGKGKVAGFRLSEINSVDKLYELIHPQDLEGVTNYSIQSICYMNEFGVVPIEHQSKIIFRVRGKGGKLYYIQRHGVANGIVNGLLVSNFSFLEDVTWMRPRPCSWHLIGPSTEAFDLDIPEIKIFRNQLSPREIEILKLVAKGFQSKDIGNMLQISNHTVSTHRKNMLKKLEVANTPELLTMAIDMGLI